MNLDTFFDNFDLLADAPNGVQKLRELILQLAVQGKLVPQDDNDEPASVLLEKIRVEKERLVEEGKIKEADFLLSIKDNEILYKLPANWVWVRLGEIVEYNGAAKVSPSNIPQDAWLLELEDIEKDSSRIIQRLIFQERESKSTKAKFSKGDVLYGKLRPYLNKVIVADSDGFCTTEIVPLRGYMGIFPQYLMYALKRPDFLKYVNSKTYGVKMPRLGTEDGRKAPFPLPPLAEQHRIVAKIDELMALCDRISSRQQQKRETRIIINNAAIGQLLTAREPEVFNKSWQHICNNFDLLYSTPDNIGKLRQAILQLAVQGKLVPQDANDEPASVLLEKIRVEKERLVEEGKIRKEKPLPAIQAEELEHNIPEKWSWSRLIDICELITDGTHQTPKYTKQGRMFLSAQNVKPFRFMPKVHRFVSEEDYQGYIKNRKPEFEDILLTRVGAGIGEAAVIDQKLDFAIYVSVALVRPFKKFIDPYYLTIWLNSPSGTHKSSINTYGKGVSQGNLNLGLINKFIVSIPPLNEQHSIVAKVNQLMSLCDELETKLTQSVTDSEKLMEAAVRQLLAANSNKTDIHESALLESIPVEAAKLETKTAGRRNKKTEGQDGEAVQLNLPIF